MCICHLALFLLYFNFIFLNSKTKSMQKIAFYANLLVLHSVTPNSTSLVTFGWNLIWKSHDSFNWITKYTVLNVCARAVIQAVRHQWFNYIIVLFMVHLLEHNCISNSSVETRGYKINIGTELMNDWNSYFLYISMTASSKQEILSAVIVGESLANAFNCACDVTLH